MYFTGRALSPVPQMLFWKIWKIHFFPYVNHSTANRHSRMETPQEETEPGLPIACPILGHLVGMCGMAKPYQLSKTQLMRWKFSFKATLSVSPEQKPHFDLQDRTIYWSGNGSSKNIFPAKMQHTHLTHQVHNPLSDSVSPFKNSFYLVFVCGRVICMWERVCTGAYVEIRKQLYFSLSTLTWDPKFHGTQVIRLCNFTYCAISPAYGEALWTVITIFKTIP